MKKHRKNIHSNTSLIKKRPTDHKEMEELLSGDDFLISEQALLEKLEELTRSKKMTVAEKEEFDDITRKLLVNSGLENGFWVGKLSYENDSTALRKMRHKIVREYNCQSSLELMLADRIVANYWSTMRHDAILNRLAMDQDGKFSFTESKAKIYKEKIKRQSTLLIING